MKSALALRQSCQTANLLMSSTNITTSAWVELIAALTYAASGVEVINNSGQPLQIAIGGAGSEVAIPYTVPPGGTPGVITQTIPKGSRISFKAIGATVNSGYLILNAFQ